MAVDRIVAWLRLRDVARFRRDAWKAAESIKGIGKASDSSQGPLNQLGGALTEFASNIPEYSGRTRIFGFAVGTVAIAAAAAIPIIVSLGGALTAVAGSAGAAALGAGLLGVAIGGLILPLGTFGLVAAQAFQGFQKVSTAFQNWQKQVAAFGKNSTQAETALARLHGTAAIFGGPVMIRAAKVWDDLQNSFRKANAPALREFAKMMIGLLHTVKNVLPLFATMAFVVGQALNRALLPFRAALESRSFQAAMMTLANSFARLAGPVIQAVVNFLTGFVAIAARMQGYLPGIADSIVTISLAFRSWAASGDLGVLVGHFFSWWNLLKAVGRLLFIVLNTGASDGKSLVDTLTVIVNKWSDWLATTKGQDSLKRFFHDAVTSAKVFIGVAAAIIKALFIFGRATMGPFAKGIGIAKNAWAQLMDALRPAKPFWDNVLKPLFEGLIGGLIGGVVGAFKFSIFVIKIFAKVLGLIGKAMAPFGFIFKAIGWLIGFVFGGEVLKAMEALSKITIVLRPLAMLFRLLRVPIEFAGFAVGKLIGWIGRLIGAAAKIAYRFAGPFREAVDTVINFLTSAGSRMFDAGMRLWNAFKRGIMRAIGAGLGFAGDIGRALWNFIAGNFNKFLPNKIDPPGPGSINLPDNPLPMLAQGGIVSGQGSWITGEAGPELNTMIDGKVQVQPLTSAVSAMSATATLAPSEPKILVSKVYLKGKQIAEAVADEAADDRARKGKHG